MKIGDKVALKNLKYAEIKEFGDDAIEIYEAYYGVQGILIDNSSSLFTVAYGTTIEKLDPLMLKAVDLIDKVYLLEVEDASEKHIEVFRSIESLKAYEEKYFKGKYKFRITEKEIR